MKPSQYGPQQIVLASSEGDVFWDLPPFITYIATTPIGTTIYVANPSAVDREYALLSRLVDASGTLLIEESIAVYDHAWFAVKAGQFVRLHAELAYEFTNAILTVALVERSTDSEVDGVSTYLVAPTASQLPPGFPGAPGAPGLTTIAGFDWTSLLMMMMFIPIIGLVVGMTREEERKAPAPSERKLLPPGRGP
jgi:hypothetical protein